MKSTFSEQVPRNDKNADVLPRVRFLNGGMNRRFRHRFPEMNRNVSGNPAGRETRPLQYVP